MIIYFIFAVVILLIQLLVLLEGYRNCLYNRRKYRPKPSKYQPTAAVICPCKGLDTTFDRNINSLFVQDYPHSLWLAEAVYFSAPACRRPHPELRPKSA